MKAVGEGRDRRGVARVAWIVASFGAGGIGVACRYAAQGLQGIPGWVCTVVSLHDPAGERLEAGVRMVSLGLEEQEAAQGILEWLRMESQDLVITNDVSSVERAFPYFPRETLHVIQVHDSLRRYGEVALRNREWVDAVCCVGRHIEVPLRKRVRRWGYDGVVSTVHNGAAFPAAPIRERHAGPMRLLFLGRIDPFKGIYDLPPVLQRLGKMGVPVQLTVAGGHDAALESRFRRAKVDRSVRWAGALPHGECYRVAAESDILLMLSRREPFGMVTIESMSMGCVPLGYDTASGTTEIIEHGKSGLLVGLGDWEALAREIGWLRDRPEEWSRLSEGAMARARSQFSHTAYGARMDAFLRRVQANARIKGLSRRVGKPVPGLAGWREVRTGYGRLPGILRRWLRRRIGGWPRAGYWVGNWWRF